MYTKEKNDVIGFDYRLQNPWEAKGEIPTNIGETDDTYYDMTFDWLNNAYTYDMYLEQGDSIEVFLEKERGKVSVLIQTGDADITEIAAK